MILYNRYNLFHGIAGFRKTSNHKKLQVLLKYILVYQSMYVHRAFRNDLMDIFLRAIFPNEENTLHVFFGSHPTGSTFCNSAFGIGFYQLVEILINVLYNT